MKLRRRRVVVVLLASALVAYNVALYCHARAMTHFTNGGARTESPDRLSTLGKIEAALTGVRLPRFESKTTPASFGLAYSTHRFASTDGIELEAWRIPRENARGVVCVFHGYAAGKAAQLGIAKELHDLGWETFLVDFRGSGGSTGSETTLGIREADDVAASVAYVASLAPGVKPVLYGTSMGSAAILRAASARHVEPRAAILECPFGRLLDAVSSRFALMGLPSWPSAPLLLFWGGGVEGFRHEPVEFARDVRCPVLVLHGEADPTVSVAQVKEIADHLGGPHELVTFPGARHESYLAKHRDAWRAAVAKFLE